MMKTKNRGCFCQRCPNIGPIQRALIRFYLVRSFQTRCNSKTQYGFKIQILQCSIKTFGILVYYFYDKFIIVSPLLVIPCFKRLVKRRAILKLLFQPCRKWQCLSKLYSWLTSTGRKLQLFCLVHILSNACMLHLKL